MIKFEDEDGDNDNGKGTGKEKKGHGHEEGQAQAQARKVEDGHQDEDGVKMEERRYCWRRIVITRFSKRS